MEILCQKDPRWANVRIGSSACLIEQWGCTICSLCMALGFLQNRFVSPAEAAFWWSFNSKGEINWGKTIFDGMAFIRRYYGTCQSQILEATTNKDRTVVAQVNYNHWIWIKDIVDGKYVFNDPLDGKEHTGLSSKGYVVTGCTVVERTYEAAPDWMADIWKRAKNHGIKENDPLTPKNAEKMQEVLVEAGILDTVEAEPSLGRWFMIMKKTYEKLYGKA